MAIGKKTILFTTLMHSLSYAEGHAKIELLSSSSTYQAGAAMTSAIRITYDKGWHGYWINPGETGMKTEVTWKLPAGWKATPLQFPAPERSTGRDVHSYDYHGTIILPLTFHAPADAAGEAIVEGEVNWLACNKDQCVAGNATVQLSLTPGHTKPTPNSDTLAKAIAALPQPSPQHQLTRTLQDGNITLRIQGSELEKFAGASVFPVTEQALDPSFDWKFELKDGICSVTGPVNEYAQESEEMTLDIVIVGKKISPPIALKWTKKL